MPSPNRKTTSECAGLDPSSPISFDRLPLIPMLPMLTRELAGLASPFAPLQADLRR